MCSDLDVGLVQLVEMEHLGGCIGKPGQVESVSLRKRHLRLLFACVCGLK